MHRLCLRRVRVARRDAAPGRAGTDADDRRSTLRRLLHDFEDRPTADHAVDSSVPDRDRAVDDEDVLAPVLLDRLCLKRFRLLAAAGAQRLVVVERDHVEDQTLDGRMMRAQQ